MQSIVRAFALLEAMGDSAGEIGIAELAKRVGLHVSTAHRLLATLVRLGYVRQNRHSGRYAVGAQALHLAESYLGQSDLRTVARPTLERLRCDTGETASLVVLDGREALYVDKAESGQSLRLFSRIGRRAPLHCTAVGKVLLAFRPPAEIEELLGDAPLERLTRRTITAPDELRQELRRVRDQGYGLDLEECEEGGACLAAPIRSVAGDVIAALSLSGPKVRLSLRRLRTIAPQVVRGAQEISEQLGYRAGRPPIIGAEDKEVRQKRRVAGRRRVAAPGVDGGVGSRASRR